MPAHRPSRGGLGGLDMTHQRPQTGDLSGVLGFCATLLSASDPPGTWAALDSLQKGTLYPPPVSLPTLFPLFRQTET